MVSRLEKLCFEVGGEKVGILEKISQIDSTIPIATRIDEETARRKISEGDTDIIIRSETPYGFKSFQGVFFSVVPGTTFYPAIDYWTGKYPFAPKDFDDIIRIIKLQEIGHATIDEIIRERRALLEDYCNATGLNINRVLGSVGYSAHSFSNPPQKGVMFEHPNIKGTYLIFTRTDDVFEADSRGNIKIMDSGVDESATRELSKRGDQYQKLVAIYRRMVTQPMFSKNSAYEIEFQTDPLLVHQVRYLRPKNFTTSGNLKPNNNIPNMCFGRTPDEGIMLEYGGGYDCIEPTFEEGRTPLLAQGSKPGRFAYFGNDSKNIFVYLPNIQALLLSNKTPGHFYSHGARANFSRVPYIFFGHKEDVEPLKQGDKIHLRIEAGNGRLERAA